jgi:flagellar biosynthesis protein FlhF
LAWPVAAGNERGPKATEGDLFVQKILSAGLFPEFVQRLAEEIRVLGKDPSTKNLTEVYRGLLNWRLMESVEVTEAPFKGPRVWSFIGPTGIGKTTTMVKLAAYYRLKATERIILITTDTYRIGAVEQLNQYAKILRLPLKIAYHPEELGQIIEKNRNQDLILIDTAGRSPQLIKPIEELRDFLCVHPKIENHLILSATTKDHDLEWIVERFRLLPISSYIFTKIDETTQYVPLFNQLVRYKRPLSYLTKGQSVPEDIEQATKPKVANMVLSAITWN